MNNDKSVVRLRCSDSVRNLAQSTTGVFAACCQLSNECDKSTVDVVGHNGRGGEEEDFTTLTLTGIKSSRWQRLEKSDTVCEWKDHRNRSERRSTEEEAGEKPKVRE